jgi:uncharacterized SAM-binding protein YcdF (DUF218 family)
MNQLQPRHYDQGGDNLEKVMRRKKKRGTGIVAQTLLLLIGAAGFVWFLLPLTLNILNLGNTVGLAVCASLILAGLFYDPLCIFLRRARTGRGGRVVTTMLGILLVLCVLTVGTLTGFMAAAANATPPSGATVVVLGCQVRGDTPSLMLQKRLDAAYTYLMENPDSVCILSGGQGPGENVTEARAMADDLVKRGIDADRLILEERSKSTEENLAYSKEIIENQGLSPLVAVVSDGFHQLRAAMIAKDLGLTPFSVSAQTPFAAFPAFYVRELFALAEQLVLK